MHLFHNLPQPLTTLLWAPKTKNPEKILTFLLCFLDPKTTAMFRGLKDSQNHVGAKSNVAPEADFVPPEST